MNRIINRYELVSMILSENFLSEMEREFVASMTDKTILSIYGKSQFKEIRKGYYLIN